MFNKLIFNRTDCFFDFPQGKSSLASLAMELPKPKSSELPRAKKVDSNVMTTLIAMPSTSCANSLSEPCPAQVAPKEKSNSKVFSNQTIRCSSIGLNSRT